ncbi:hypothetical protein Prum_016440 [Phytohabitans rumicis]|uniref:Response regulatory domain-containing protein n=1 Tax=Phytohabitans rumicis TaxID=1076125 RepID=A0A6V8KS84_9ACTN|nr:hypothetical protein Prum_016440 [Phytohabitans rumicis]
MTEPAERPDLILVVDDDQDIARFVQVNLKIHGFDVLVAGTGRRRWTWSSTTAPTWPWST